MTTPLKFMTGTVLARRMVTPGMVRITLGGDGLRELKSTGVGDEYIRLFFPDRETGELVLPALDDRGHWVWPEGKRQAHCVCYTIRNARPGEIDVDFVVHDGGIASEWAMRTEPGDVITLREPFGIYDAPADADWQLFVSDATGLPALGRLIESLGPNVEVRAIIEVPDASHEQAFEATARLKVIWLHGSGNAAAPSRLLDAVRGMELPANCRPYVWIAGEVKAARAIRKYLRHELGWDAAKYSVTGYWTEKKAEWTAGWDALDATIKQRIDDLWDSDRNREEVADEVEATLERHGL